MARREGETGQATVEWTALVLLVAIVAIALASLAGARLPGLVLANALAQRLVCAVGLDDGCTAGPDELVAAYGDQLAAEVRRRAPTISYEDGMRALPIDFRTCREDPCSLGAEAGEVLASDAGEPVTLFVHVVDCRPGAEAPPKGVDCTGEREGNLYLQYWAYYPGSQSSRELLGEAGFHPDDWESLQLRVGPGGPEARASSHHGYNHSGGAGNWLSDAGITSRSAWGPAAGRYYVSGGSHAGHAWERDARLVRWTPGDRIRLIPIESLSRRWLRTAFAVTPPWRKRVYRDPEHEGTD